MFKHNEQIKCKFSDAAQLIHEASADLISLTSVRLVEIMESRADYSDDFIQVIYKPERGGDRPIQVITDELYDWIKSFPDVVTMLRTNALFDHNQHNPVLAATNAIVTESLEAAKNIWQYKASKPSI